jgi:SAM-dependent methyltransferase
VPVSDEDIQEARAGRWEVILTPIRPVPRSWLGELEGRQVLCLASAGGQQAPVLAAAGARVVSFDLSEEQLARDQEVARRHGLPVECIQGDMTDLSALASESFDLVFNPVSTVFVPDVARVWREASKVLKPGGALLSGFMNPSFYLFDHDAEDGSLTVRYRLPYAETDPDTLPPQRRKAVEEGDPLEFSHTLEALIGGQLEAGLVITGFYEDWWEDDATPLNRFSPTFMATRGERVDR